MTETKHTPEDHKWFDPECGQNGCQSLVWRARYEDAVKGRSDFRQSYRDARAELSRLRNSHTALVAALESFANKADAYDGLPEPKYFGDTDFTTRYPDSTKATVTVGELRRARAALSAEGEKDAPKDDGWIEWKGGECPVRPRTIVETRFDDGSGSINRALTWSWDDEALVAYRVVKP